MPDIEKETNAKKAEKNIEAPVRLPAVSQLKREISNLSYPEQMQMLQPPLPMLLRDNGSDVQPKGGSGSAGSVHAAAAEGVSGAGTELPHLGPVQQSFGHHDVSGVKAHVGGAAFSASESMGAKAYATGNNVAFKQNPDIHTAAHEAAHVVQQRAGVSLKDGVGRSGDPYEKHADAVADRVSQGKSAQGLLDKATGGSSSDIQASVQGLSPEGFVLETAGASTLGSSVQAKEEGGEEETYEEYTVKQFETLSGIAKRKLGNPYRWKEIGELNGISDRRGCKAGQKLKIPNTEGGKKASGAESRGVSPDPAKSLPEPKENKDTTPDKDTDAKVGDTSEKAAEPGAPQVDKPPAGKEGPLSIAPPTPNPGMKPTETPAPLVCDVNYHSGTTPPISLPKSPHILDNGGHDMDYMFTDRTDFTPDEHVCQIQESYSTLAAKTEEAKSELSKTANGLTTDIANIGKSKTSEVNTKADAKSMSLSELMSASISDLAAMADAAIAEAKAKEEAAVKAAQEGAKQSNEQMNTAFITATIKLNDAKIEWEGSYSTTVTAQAQKIYKLGEQYEETALIASEQADADAKKAGETGNGEMAFDEADLKSRAKIYKNYAPAFKKYASQAANFLVEAAAQGKNLSEKLLAPSIDSLEPAATAHQIRVGEEAENYTEKIQKETGTYVEKTTEIKDRDQTFVEGQKTEAVTTTQQAKEGVKAQVKSSTDNLEAHTQKATTQLTSYRDNTICHVDDIAANNQGLPRGEYMTEAAGKLKDKINEETNTQMCVLDQDKQSAWTKINKEADERMCTIDQGVEGYKEQVVSGVKTSKDAIGDAGKEADKQISVAGDSTDRTLKEVGKETSKNTCEGSVETDTGSKDYQKTVLERLKKYTESAIMELLTLKNKMDTAADDGGQKARSKEAGELKRRYKEAYEAIDGAGTDESKLIKSVQNVSKAESAYIQDKYKPFAGVSLRADIIDDTSEGDNVREACFSYLEGDVIAGAKYAMKYATEYSWSNAFGADTDLLNTTMSSLNEEQRTKLLNDPEFPALKQKIETRLNQEKNDPIFGANKYDVDTFAVLADKNVSHKDAHLKVEVIKLTKAFEGTNNPFTWGTDEAAVWAVMGKLEGEDLAQFKKMFKDYHGSSLESEMADELSGLEYKRGMALARGDKEAAQVYAVEYALQDGDEEAVFTLLDDPDLSNSADWLAQKQAQSKRERLITGWQDEFGKGTTLKQSLQDRLKSEGTNAAEIGVALLYGQSAPVEYLLAYAIIRSGTNEAYAQKAITQLKAEMAALKTKEEKAARWAAICKWFNEKHGIKNLELYLGVGKYKYLPGGNYELDGQERQDFDIILQEAKSDMKSVKDLYALAKNNYEWYRGRGANPVGSAVTDLFTSSGERLDHFWKQVNDLHNDESWYHEASGNFHVREGFEAKWKEYEEACERLNLMSDVYKGKRDAITNAICTILVTIAAVVSTVLTGGGLAPLWVGVAITAGAAVVSIAIKAVMKGASYGEQEMIIDVVKAAVEAVVSMATAGVGGQWFARTKAFLDKLAKGGVFSRAAGMFLSGLPGGLVEVLTDERTWENPRAFFGALGVMGFKLIATSFTGALTDKYIRDAVGGKMGAFIKVLVDKPLESLLDPANANATSDQIAWGVLKGWLQGAAEIGGTALAQGYLVKKYNGQGKLTKAQIDRLAGIDPDVRDEIFDRLDDGVQQSMPKSLWPKAALDALETQPDQDETTGTDTTTGGSSDDSSEPQTGAEIAQKKGYPEAPDGYHWVKKGDDASLQRNPGKKDELPKITFKDGVFVDTETGKTYRTKAEVDAAMASRGGKITTGTGGDSDDDTTDTSSLSGGEIAQKKGYPEAPDGYHWVKKGDDAFLQRNPGKKDEIPNVKFKDGEFVDTETGQTFQTKAEVDDYIKVKATAKGSRPDPYSYIPPEKVAKHLEEFSDGASYLVPKDILDRFGRDTLGWPDNSQFVMSKGGLDSVLAKANGDISVIEKELGIPAGSWQGRTLCRIDIPNPQELNVRLPSGNEMGANEEWLPGGKLPTGYAEAVVDKVAAGQYTETVISGGGS